MNPLNNQIINNLDVHGHNENPEVWSSTDWNDSKALDDYRYYYIRSATAKDITQQCCFCTMNNIERGDKIARSRGQGGSSDFFRTYHIECMANMIEQIYVNMKDSVEEMKTLYNVEGVQHKLTREYINRKCNDNIVVDINKELKSRGLNNYVEWKNECFVVHEHAHNNVDATPPQTLAEEILSVEECRCKVCNVEIWNSKLSGRYYSSTQKIIYGDEQRIDQDKFVSMIEAERIGDVWELGVPDFIIDTFIKAIDVIDNYNITKTFT